MSRIHLVAAVTRDAGVGRDNELLVRIPEDMARFKALTMGHAVVMGRKTWDSIPAKFRPLPGRRNLVLSRQAALQLEGAEVATSLVDALAACADASDVFIIGGAQIYAQALPLADVLELTELDTEFPADAFFPPWRHEDFACIARERHQSASGWAYDFASYERRRPHEE